MPLGARYYRRNRYDRTQCKQRKLGDLARRLDGSATDCAILAFWRNPQRSKALHRAGDGYDEKIGELLASEFLFTSLPPEARAMSQAIVDPAELRRFANNLKKFNQELEERMTSLRGQLQALGTTWRDQEHKKFTDDFEHQMQVIAKFVEATNEHTPFLLRKAERIEEYLQQR